MPGGALSRGEISLQCNQLVLNVPYAVNQV
jgi:hypothetical protein